MPRHHPVFSEFTPYEGSVPSGFQISDFLGLKTRPSFVAGLMAASGAAVHPVDYVTTGYPAFNDDYFLWIDLLTAVLAAGERLTVVELGTGYGEWLARACLAARHRRPDVRVRLVGVEAEPTHFQWMRQHLIDNGIDPLEHDLIEAAVTQEDGTVEFFVGNPDGWYGQAIAPVKDRMGGVPVQPVRAVTLRSVLGSVDEVDLLHLDVQGEELKVLASAVDDVAAKVKRVHINTHGRELERGLRELFWDAGWHKLNDYSLSSVELTPFGEIAFPDGVQSWTNPRLVTPADIATAYEHSQRTLRTADARQRRLEIEIEQLRASLHAAVTPAEAPTI